MTTKKKIMKPTKRKQNLPKVSGVDLFCGVGGLTHGLIKSGIKVRAGIDLDTTCKYAYEVNNKAEFIGADISEIKGEHIQNFWQDNDYAFIIKGADPKWTTEKMNEKKYKMRFKRKKG